MNIKREKLAYEKGYRVRDGIVYGLKNNIRKPDICRKGYYRFTFPMGSRKDNTRKMYCVWVHRLVAYQKYGDQIFEEGIEVRHLDGNSLNNLDGNIEIGTHSDNMMDIPQEQRRINAGNQSRIYPHKEVLDYYNQTRSYKKTMEKFGIKSKGTINYIKFIAG